jgi:protein-S-isoprenylcysteine O-methyltransferase Ste14
MSKPVLLLILLNFASVGLLTAFFFRKVTRLGVRWWATALPFLICPAFLITAAATGLAPTTPGGWAAELNLAAVAFSSLSIALMYLTWGTHRIALRLWHQDAEEPGHLVTSEPYGIIRHPFYTSYLLAFAAAASLFPHWVTLFLLGYVSCVLTITATQEERRLSASAFGPQYRQYMAQAGRFFPHLGPRRGLPGPSEATSNPLQPHSQAPHEAR